MSKKIGQIDKYLIKLKQKADNSNENKEEKKNPSAEEVKQGEGKGDEVTHSHNSGEDEEKKKKSNLEEIKVAEGEGDDIKKKKSNSEEEIKLGESEDEDIDDILVDDKLKKKRKCSCSSSVNRQAKKRKQKFRVCWLLLDELTDWLKPHPEEKSKARCAYCNTEFTADIYVIKRHARTELHEIRRKDFGSSQKKITAFTKNETSQSFKERLKIAELKLVGFLVEHYLSLRVMDHLPELLKTIFVQDPLVESIHMKRTKARAIAVNVIGASHKQDLIDVLKKVKFSIISDESTDISTQKNCCVIVRFFDTRINKIISKFFELAKVFDDSETAQEGATGERLYTVITKAFADHNIPGKNIIGFGADNCSVNMGINNSISSRLKENLPGIVIIGCICHSLHICASEASKELPRHLEDLAKSVYSFFSHSSKRSTEFLEFIDFVNMDPLKLLHPSQTRWLSLKAVVERILKLWDALVLYFIQKVSTEKLVAADNILRYLQNPYTKLYFFFLDWVLKIIVGANEYFQSEKVVVMDVHDKMCEVYREILFAYLKREYVINKNLSEVEPRLSHDDKNLLPLRNMYLGVEVQRRVSELESMALKETELQKNSNRGPIPMQASFRQPVANQPGYMQVKVTTPNQAVYRQVVPKQPGLRQVSPQTATGIGHNESFKSPQQRTKEEIDGFYYRCQQFLMKAAEEIRSRYNFDSPIFSKLSWLKIKNVLNSSFREKCPSLQPLMALLPRIVDPKESDLAQAIDNQWRRLPYAANLPEEVFQCYQDELNKEKDNDKNKDKKRDKNKDTLAVDVFWSKIMNFKSEAGVTEFFEVGQFALDVLSLPHTSSDAERMFSRINLIKTKLKNKMTTETVNGLVLAVDAVKDNLGGAENNKEAGTCINFTPTTRMIQSMKSDIMYPTAENSTEEQEEDDAALWDMIVEATG